MERIKFYSIHDLSSGIMLKKIEEMVINGSFKQISDINDVIEAHNIIRFIDNDITLNNWDDVFKFKYREHKTILWEIIGKFFSNICNENILEIMKSLEANYREDFFFLFAKFNLQDIIDWNTLNKAINQKVIYISLLLRDKKISSRYAIEIRDSLLSKSDNAELFFHNLEKELTDDEIKFIFPKTMSDKDVNDLFESYIDSPHPNINYLRNIKNYRNGISAYDISKNVKYKAQLRISDMEKEIFCDKDSGVKTTVEISFQKIDAIIKQEDKGLHFKLIYSSDWIEKHNSNKAILGNFINLFQYVNQLFQINLFSKDHDGSVIEKALSNNLKSDYDANSVFVINNMVADLQILAYSKKLRDLNIHIESALEWYYREHLYEKFGIESFQISLLKNNGNYYEMCKSIVPEIESVAKQYLVFVEKGQIDHKYISAVNPDVMYKELPSKLKSKYAYPCSRDILYILTLLFSPQSILSYIPKYDTDEKNFVDLIENKRPGMIDFEKHQTKHIEYLIDKCIVEVDEKSKELNFVDTHRISLLRTLYDYGFLSIQSYSGKYKGIIESFISHGDLDTSSTLLSKQEAAYFNYYLNSAEFGNSKDLRNKYVHGSSGEIGETNEQDYFTLLKILILLTLKIENDLNLSLIDD